MSVCEQVARKVACESSADKYGAVRKCLLELSCCSVKRPIESVFRKMGRQVGSFIALNSCADFLLCTTDALTEGSKNSSLKNMRPSHSTRYFWTWVWPRTTTPGKQVGFASEQHDCAAPRTNVPRARTKNTALNEQRTVMQQSEQPCDRVKPRTNLPFTACSSKCLASQEIVPLTTNALCAWTSDSDRDDDGDVFGSAVGLPTPVTEGGRSHSDGIKTCQSGTRRTERTNKPRTVVASPTQLRTPWCARCFKNEREQNTIHKTEFADQERLHL